MRSRLSSFRHSIDLGLFLPTAGLLLIGLMVVGSLRLSDLDPVDAWKSTLVWGHLVRTAIALVLMVGVMSVPLERIQRVGLLLCLFVLGVPIIYEFNAFYWIGMAVWRPTWLYVDLPLFGGRSVNWLHWVLLAIPLALASWMAWVERERWPIALVTAVGLLVPVFLILAEHPFRGGWILLVALSMLAVARWRRSLLLVVLGVPTVVVALVVSSSPSPLGLGTDLSWIREDLYDVTSPLGRSLEAIASAGLLGKGWGQGPVSHCLDSLHYQALGSDRAASMAFTVFTEEFGVLGAVVLIGLVLALSLRGLQIAARAQGFARFAAVGLSLMLFGSAFLHIASVTHLLDASVLGGYWSPRGLPLPLVGVGGNAMAVNLIAIGLLDRFGRTAPPPAPGRTAPPAPRSRALPVVAGLLIAASLLLVARTLDLQRGEYGYGKDGLTAPTCRANARTTSAQARENAAQQRMIATERLLLWVAQLRSGETETLPRLLAFGKSVDFIPTVPSAPGDAAGEPSAGVEEPGAPPRWLQASLSGILNSPFPPPSIAQDYVGERWLSHHFPEIDRWCVERGTRARAACIETMAPELVPWFSTLDDASIGSGAFDRALSATGAVRRILRSRAAGDADAPGLEIASLPGHDGSRLVAVAFPDAGPDTGTDAGPTCGSGACRTPTLLYRVTTAPDGQETPTLILISTQDWHEMGSWSMDGFDLFAYGQRPDGVDAQIDSVEVYRCDPVCWPRASRWLKTTRTPGGARHELDW
jgi:rod shape determining protein RodA